MNNKKIINNKSSKLVHKYCKNIDKNSTTLINNPLKYDLKSSIKNINLKSIINKFDVSKFSINIDSNKYKKHKQFLDITNDLIHNNKSKLNNLSYKDNRHLSVSTNKSFQARNKSIYYLSPVKAASKNNNSFNYNKMHCPYCLHCNKNSKISNNISNYINNYKDLKSTINSLFEYTCEILKNGSFDKSNKDKIYGLDKNKYISNNIVNSIKKHNQKENDISNENVIKNETLNDFYDIENLLKNIPKLSNSFQNKEHVKINLLSKTLNLLLDQDIPIEKVLASNTLNYLNETYLSEGKIYKTFSSQNALNIELNKNDSLNDNCLNILFDKLVLDVLPEISKKQFIKHIAKIIDLKYKTKQDLSLNNYLKKLDIYKKNELNNFNKKASFKSNINNLLCKINVNLNNSNNELFNHNYVSSFTNSPCNKKLDNCNNKIYYNRSNSLNNYYTNNLLNSNNKDRTTKDVFKKLVKFNQTSNNKLNNKKTFSKSIEYPKIKVTLNNTFSQELNNLYEISSTKNNADLDNYVVSKEFLLSKQKKLVCFSIIMHFLSNMYYENKDSSILLFKAIMYYIIEYEKINNIEKVELTNIINYHRELLLFILDTSSLLNNSSSIINKQDSNINITKEYEYTNNETFKLVEDVSFVMAANKPNINNLNNHKRIIKKLLSQITSLKETIYILKSDINQRDKELNQWVYNWDIIKLDNNCRQQIKKLDVNKIIEVINYEFCHKKLSILDKSLLVNSQIYQSISSQNDYFINHKNYYISEISKYRDLYNNTSIKNIENTKQYQKEMTELNNNIIKLKGKIVYLEDKLKASKSSVSSQTEINTYIFNKMVRDYHSIRNAKNIIKSKLDECIERIKYNISYCKPLDLKSLLYFIPEIYNEKLLSNMKNEVSNKNKELFDQFFYNYMKSTYKIEKLVKHHIEETILGVQIYYLKDKRIQTFGRFLGIGDPIRKEVLDVYLAFLRNLPISFFRMFEDNYKSYTIKTNECYEIYYCCLHNYKLIYNLKYDILKKTKVYINNKETKLENINIHTRYSSNNNSFKKMSKKLSHISINNNVGECNNIVFNEEDVKFDLLCLTNIKDKSFLFVDKLINQYKQGIEYICLKTIIEQFKLINKEYNINDYEAKRIIDKYFVIEGNKLYLESFVEFYNNKHLSFKLNMSEYIDFTLNVLTKIYNQIEEFVLIQCKIIDYNNLGYLTIETFKDVLVRISYINDRNDYKIVGFFNKIMNLSERDIILYEEIVRLCFNELDLLNYIIPKLDIASNNLKEKLIDRKQQLLQRVVTKLIFENENILKKYFDKLCY